MQCEKNETGFCVENDDFKLNLSFQNDDLELWGDILRSRAGKKHSPDELIAMLNRLGLKGQIEIKNVQMFCIAISEGRQLSNVVLMRGSEPVGGIDGRVDLCSAETKNGKGQVEQITSVKAGQKIAVLVAPTAGNAGMTLKGQVIPARSGAVAKLRLGNGVQWAPGVSPDSGQGDIVASIDGLVVYDVPGATIFIQDVLTVEGNVDLKYGNIDFIGTIVINGDVTNGHVIKAGKGLKIKGNVESAFLEAGGDIEIGGGVAGKEKGMIKSGGDVSLRYLDCCNVECRGNLTVRNEIVDCCVMSGGCVEVTNGPIIGGKVVALNGIEAKSLGSEAGIPTVVVSGKNYIGERDITDLNNENRQINEQLEAISRKLDPYIKNPKQLSRMTERERQELQHMTGEFTRLNLRLKNIPDEIAAIREKMTQGANPMINAGKMIAKGVELNINNTSMIISESLNKSVSVVKNSIADGLRFINRIRLSDNAAKIERDIARVEMQRQLQQQQR